MHNKCETLSVCKIYKRTFCSVNVHNPSVEEGVSIFSMMLLWLKSGHLLVQVGLIEGRS